MVNSELMFQNVPLALKLLREMKGLSQLEAARAAGIGKSQLSKYENSCKELPKLESLAKVLAVLDFQPLTFFYVVHLLGRVKGGEAFDASSLIGTDFGQVVPEPEQAAYAKLLSDFVGLFIARIDAGLPAQDSVKTRKRSP